MANWKVFAPPSVKAPTKAVAERNARGLVTVSKIVVPTTPAFLNGLKPLWSDDCSSPTPVEDGRWSFYPTGRKDGRQEASADIDDIKPGRFIRVSNGEPKGEPYYQFYAPSGDNIWTSGAAGRSELSYPRGGIPSGHPGPHSDVVYFLEGQRYVILESVRLPAAWDVRPVDWRVLTQLKQSEWEDQRGLSPALALEQRSSNWIITSFGGPVIWSVPATAGTWERFAFDVTFSADPSKGRLKVYMDRDLDGVYEYASAVWSGKTLADNGSLSSWIPSTIHTGLYEGAGGDTAHHANPSIWSTP